MLYQKNFVQKYHALSDSILNIFWLKYLNFSKKERFYMLWNNEERIDFMDDDRRNIYLIYIFLS